MGTVFGLTGSEEPKYVLLQKDPFEIRQYPQYVVAEVKMDNKASSTTSSSASNSNSNSNSSGESDTSSAFRVLAKYIGVFGNPANESLQPMAMTAPVITRQDSGEKGQKMAMTAPVLQSDQLMGFVLPFEFTDAATTPKPTDSRVTLRTVPGKIVACRCFSGRYTRDLGRAEFKQLRGQLLASGLIQKTSPTSSDGDDSDDTSWTTAQYHPPYTIPYFRRNEIWIDLNEALPPVKLLLQTLRSAAK